MLTSEQALSRSFLEVRCAIIDIGATLDRIDRGAGSSEDDPRLLQLRDALRMLAEPSPEPNRTERLLLHFSDAEQAGALGAGHESRPAK